jgi:hypothetical protein
LALADAITSATDFSGESLLTTRKNGDDDNSATGTRSFSGS